MSLRKLNLDQRYSVYLFIALGLLLQTAQYCSSTPQTASPKPYQWLVADEYRLRLKTIWNGLTGSSVSIHNGYALLASPGAPDSPTGGFVQLLQTPSSSDPNARSPGSLWVYMTTYNQDFAAANLFGKSVRLAPLTTMVAILGAPNSYPPASISRTGYTVCVKDLFRVFNLIALPISNGVKGEKVGCLVSATSTMTGYVSCGINAVTLVRIDYLAKSGQYAPPGKLLAKVVYPSNYSTFKSFDMSESQYIVGISDSGMVIVGKYQITSSKVTVESLFLEWPQLLSDSFNNQNTSLFGYSVAVTKNHIAVGAPGYNQKSGVVILYDAYALTVVELIYPPFFEPFRFFGASVSMEGPFIAVGGAGCGYQFETCLSGRAYIYHVNGTMLAMFRAKDGLAGDNYGVAVDITYNYLIVGADRYYADRSGLGYIYPSNTTSWDGIYVPGSPGGSSSNPMKRTNSMSHSKSHISHDNNDGTSHEASQKGNSMTPILAGGCGGIFVVGIAVFVWVRRKRKPNNVQPYNMKRDVESVDK